MELLASLGREALVGSSSNSPDHPSGGGLPLAGQAGRQYFLLVEQADWACERGTLSNPENQIRIKGVNVPTSVSQTGDLNRAQYYELIRNQIEHEDQTVNQRVIWQIISQAFFFGAYASLVTAPQQARDPVFQALQQFLLWAMPVAALLAGLLTYMSILASLRTMAYLRGLYENYANEGRPDDASSKLYPDIHGPAQARRWAIFTPLAMPLVFIITWIAVIAWLIVASWS
jgi:hypothetical protein